MFENDMNDIRWRVNKVVNDRDFDKSVDYAIKFAKNRNDTVVIVCPDHGNGGLSIGAEDIGNK